jgi:hypothetical protein
MANSFLDSKYTKEMAVVPEIKDLFERATPRQQQAINPRCLARAMQIHLNNRVENSPLRVDGWAGSSTMSLYKAIAKRDNSFKLLVVREMRQIFDSSVGQAAEIQAGVHYTPSVLPYGKERKPIKAATEKIFFSSDWKKNSPILNSYWRNEEAVVNFKFAGPTAVGAVQIWRGYNNEGKLRPDIYSPLRIGGVSWVTASGKKMDETSYVLDKKKHDKVFPRLKLFLQGKNETDIIDFRFEERITELEFSFFADQTMEKPAVSIGRMRLFGAFLGKTVPYIPYGPDPILAAAASPEYRALAKEVIKSEHCGIKDKDIEGTFDVMYGGNAKGNKTLFLRPPKPISTMTLKELRAFQTQYLKAQKNDPRANGTSSTAAGAIQILKATLDEQMAKHPEVFTPDTIFNETTQYALYVSLFWSNSVIRTLVEKALYRGYKWTTVDINKVRNALADQWASIPDSSGHSHYKLGNGKWQPVCRNTDYWNEYLASFAAKLNEYYETAYKA